MYQPLNKNIVLEEINEEAKTKSGIIIAGTEVADIVVPKGKVIAISSAVRTPLELGDIVVYPKYAGLLLDEGVRIIEIDQVLAICPS